MYIPVSIVSLSCELIKARYQLSLIVGIVELKYLFHECIKERMNQWIYCLKVNVSKQMIYIILKTEELIFMVTKMWKILLIIHFH